MKTQKFKGDVQELKMEACGADAMQVCSADLDAFKENGYNAEPFLLMLYDAGRMPFSDRVPRDSFVSFIREALARFPFTGTFESYIFIMESIFGAGSSCLFNIPAPGKLEMLVNAASSLSFDFVVKELVNGSFELNNLTDSFSNQLVARGISGIDSEYELALLLSELIPAGIYPDITLSFFSIYNFADSSGNSIVTNLGDQIIFLET